MDVPRRFLTAQWRHLAILNYVVPQEVLRSRVPRGTSLDLYDGHALVSVVGFRFLNTRLLGIPIPFHRNFEELNLRFYVKREVGGELRRGVTFIKELVPRFAIARVARWAYNENYFSVPMRHQLRGFDVEDHPGSRHVHYHWRFDGIWHEISLETCGPAGLLRPKSLEEFVTEHYWGYCTQRDGGTVEYQVTHPAWRVWRECQAEFKCDAHALYGGSFGGPLSGEPHSVLLADGSDVCVYRPTRLQA